MIPLDNFEKEGLKFFGVIIASIIVVETTKFYLLGFIMIFGYLAYKRITLK